MQNNERSISPQLHTTIDTGDLDPRTAGSNRARQLTPLDFTGNGNRQIGVDPAVDPMNIYVRIGRNGQTYGYAAIATTDSEATFTETQQGDSRVPIDPVDFCRGPGLSD